MRFPRPTLVLIVASLLLGGLLVPAPAARAVGVWTPAAALPAGYPTPGPSAVTLTLRDGRVLLAAWIPASRGGPESGVTLVYDPAADRWAVRAPIPLTQGNDAPVLLADGRVLFSGGVACSGSIPVSCSKLNAAQVYDPAADTWTPVAAMPTRHDAHTATLLPDGTVLVAGGNVASGASEAIVTNVVERYDPRTNRWSTAAPLAVTRLAHTATLLRDGRVLVAGGLSSGAQPGPIRVPTVSASAELYDPAADRWTPAASMTDQWRSECCTQTASSLPDGRVLITGTYQPRAQVYDPAADRWTPTGSMTTARARYSVTPLPDGRVLAVGGDAFSSGECYPCALASTEIYDPVTNTWAGNSPLSGPRVGHHAAATGDGRVLVIGGRNRAWWQQDGEYLTTAEIYTPVPAPEACFAETGKCIRGPFLASWEARGGLAVNGYPLSDEFVQLLEDGKAYQVQYFERTRLEYHSEHAGTPHEVLLGQFGRRIRPADPPAAPIPGQVHFPETGHNLGDGFLAYWQANGGLPQFGYPISEVFEERLEDGKTYRVQYFERARFEYHPENQAPYDILLGQFGRRILAEVERGR